MECSALQAQLPQLDTEIISCKEQLQHLRFKQARAHPDRQRQSSLKDRTYAASVKMQTETRKKIKEGELESKTNELKAKTTRLKALTSSGVLSYQDALGRARALLEGSDDVRALYDLNLMMRQMERVEPSYAPKRTYVRSWRESRDLQRPSQVLPPLYRGAGTIQPPPRARHICTPMCVAACPRAALMSQLKHLMTHCAGTGVSAFPGEVSVGEHHLNGADPVGGGSGDGEGGSGPSLLKWTCSIAGPKQTPWEGRMVCCTLNFCAEVTGGTYPLSPPQLRVVDPIPWHPNIDEQSGAVCMSLLQDEWSAGLGVLGLLISFRSLLASPNVADASDMPANVSAAHTLLADPYAYRDQNLAIARRMKLQ